jgi:hypothetical protein
MAAGHIQTDVLSRVRREQRMHGKPSRFSGLRIVLAAAAITLTLLLLAFGAIGMLLMARAPQEPLASKLDPSPPLVQQTEVPASVPQAEIETPTSVHEKTPEAEKAPDSEKKTVKTLRVIAPPAPEEKPNDAVVQQAPPTEPETTATIPPAPKAQEERQVPKRAVQPRQRQQQAVRRTVPDTQSDNPFFQLFGIRKYR